MAPAWSKVAFDPSLGLGTRARGGAVAAKKDELSSSKRLSSKQDGMEPPRRFTAEGGAGVASSVCIHCYNKRRRGRLFYQSMPGLCARALLVWEALVHTTAAAREIRRLYNPAAARGAAPNESYLECQTGVNMVFGGLCTYLYNKYQRGRQCLRL